MIYQYLGIYVHFSTLCTYLNMGDQQVDKVPHELILNFYKPIATSSYTVREHHLQTTWTWLYDNSPVNQSASPCPCRRASIRHVCHKSQVTDKCCTLTLKYSVTVQLYLQHPLKMVETFTGTPLICAMCYVLLSLLVWCLIAHKVIKVIKQTSWTCQ